MTDRNKLRDKILYSPDKTILQKKLGSELYHWRWYENDEKLTVPKIEPETIDSIQEVHPVTKEDLLGAVYGMGITNTEQLGDEIIEIVKHYYTESNLTTGMKRNGPGKIYRIWFSNDPENKSYIGQTIKLTLKDRIEEHKQNYYLKNYECPLLYKAMAKFGIENLMYELLEDNIEFEEELDSLELYYIRNYNGNGTLYPYGYNKSYAHQHKNMTRIN